VRGITKRVHRAIPLLLFLLCLGATVGAVLLDDHQAISGLLFLLAMLAVAGVFVTSREARAGMVDRFPRTAWFAKRVMALRWRFIGGALAVAVALFLLAEGWKALTYPEGDLRAHLRDRYGDTMRSDRSPLLVSADLDADWQPEDQRYTPAGVFLRYERDIVALLPDGEGGTRIDVEDDLDGFRRFHVYVGDFWGPSYHEKADVPRSALAVPGEEDLRAAARELAEAREVQGVCYGWDLDIRSGVRKGPFTRPVDEARCGRYVVLEGWIDPNAGRFTRRGDPGDWRLGYRWRLDGPIPGDAIDAVDTPHVELIEGATQQPSGDGSRAGKGVLENIGAMPLLAQETPGIGPVPPRTEHVAAAERPAPVERTDSERRAEESLVVIPTVVLQLTSVAIILFVLLTLPIALVVRLVRRLRGAKADPVFGRRPSD
jgi:uncharacterized protein DUF4247